MAALEYPAYWNDYNKGQSLQRRQQRVKFAQLDKPGLGEIVLSGASKRWDTDPTYSFVTNPELLVAGPRELVNLFLRVVKAENLPGGATIIDANTVTTPQGKALYDRLVDEQKRSEKVKTTESSVKSNYTPEKWLLFGDALKGKEKVQWMVIPSKSGLTTTTGRKSRASTLADKIAQIDLKNRQAMSENGDKAKFKVLDVSKLIIVGDKKGTGARSIAMPSRTSTKKGAYDPKTNKLLVSVVSNNQATFAEAMEMLADQTGDDGYRGVIPYYNRMAITPVGGV